MELAALSRRYGELYAPAFALRIGGADLVRDLLVPVSQLEVDLVLGASGRFSFTVVSAYSTELHAFLSGRNRKVLDLLGFGTEIDFYMGYGDAKSMPALMSGIVTEIGTSFPDGAMPELAISGYDHAFLLTQGKSSRTWTRRKDSDAAQEIAGFHNLAANIEPTSQTHEQIEQNQESDWEFLKKIADRNHYEIFVDERRTLHFRKPNDRADAAVRLAWGEGLLSFKPQANLAGQISKVEVYGWDPQKKEQIVGTAAAGEESGLNGRSGGQALGKFVRDPSKRPTLRLRQPVFTQSEANQRAKAALNERAKEFLTGDAEAVGLPDILPDRNVFLDKLGTPFSKIYYVQQATHKIDGNGYRTRFKVKETGL